MKVSGIIAEYNPFHNGHAYQLQKVRKETKADYLVIAMSGDFLQRGVPAVLDKYARAQMALSAGADLVLELPARWATASAEYFAGAGVQLLAKTGVVETVCYGCEEAAPKLLRALSEVMLAEPDEFSKRLKEQLKNGVPYPLARAEAACRALPDWDSRAVRSFLSSPNNILALEYEKAIRHRNTDAAHKINGYGIRRVGAGYHSTELSDSFASATAIRALLSGANADAGDPIDTLRDYVPGFVCEALCAAKAAGRLLDPDDFSEALYARLWSLRGMGYERFADCSADLSHRIENNLDAFTGFTNFAERVKSRDLTHTRICRALLHILLDIRQSDYDGLWTEDGIPFLRVLGFRKDAAPLLSAIKKEASAPLVTKVADASRTLSPGALALLQQDIRCADLYRGIAAIHCADTLPNEYEQGLLIF